MNISKKSAVKSIAIAGIASAAFFGSSELRSSQAAIATTEATPYVLSVTDAIAVTELVTSVGGQVGESTAFGVVEATLTEDQLQLISRSDDVSRISEVESGAADAVTAISETDSLQVAGWWWAN
ncbi:MAG: hypothetical protein AAGI24_02385 [Pseudomonadota bacterium]